jgi:hypothetical protein
MALCSVCQNPLPEPVADRCPSCGATLEAPAAPPPLPPAFPAGSEAPRPGAWSAGGWSSGSAASGEGTTPWDQRERIGLLTALVDTTRLVLGRPGEFFRGMPVTGGLGAPLLYGVLVGWLGLVAASLYQAIFRSIVGSSLGAFGDRPELTALLGWVESWAGFVAQVVFGWVFVAIGIFVTAAILHVMLLLLGGVGNGFEATFRVVCFAQATSLVLVIPFCGQIVHPVWTLVLAVIGLAAAHRIGHGKAAAAVLLPVLLFCCCCVGAILLFAGALASLASQVR